MSLRSKTANEPGLEKIFPRLNQPARAQVGLASISLISIASLPTADELWQAARRVVRLAAKIDRLF
jgi:hypothetical protein